MNPTRSGLDRRRGLSLLELVLALAMTTLVATGVAGMLAGLGSGIAVGRDARTAMLATAEARRDQWRAAELPPKVGYWAPPAAESPAPV